MRRQSNRWSMAQPRFTTSREVSIIPASRQNCIAGRTWKARAFCSRHARDKLKYNASCMSVPLACTVSRVRCLPLAPTNPYEATKLEGELLALSAYQEQGLPVTVVRPGLVYGPGDLHLLGFFVTINKGLFRVIDGGKASLHPVYIDDLMAALLLCAERPQASGRSYNVAGEHPATVRELAAAIAHALDRELPVGSIPLWLANLASDIFAVVPGMKGERAPLTRSRVKFLTNSRIYDISRATSELGFAPKVGLEKGMKLTAAWYYKHGYLDDSSRSWRTVR